MRRKIAAIVAADVAGYSQLITRDEEGTLARLRERRGTFEAAIGRLHGRVFNTAGDAIMAEFASAVSAVRCAIEVQEAFAALNDDLAPDQRMEFRIGITIGDVVEQDGDLLGDGVNIAARLEGVAPVGGIAISRSVYEATLNKVQARFEDKGVQRLKNIAEPVHVYAFLPRTAAAANRTARNGLALSGFALAGVAVLLGAGYGLYKVRHNPLPAAVAVPQTPATAPSTPQASATSTPAVAPAEATPVIKAEAPAADAKTAVAPSETTTERAQQPAPAAVAPVDPPVAPSQPAGAAVVAKAEEPAPSNSREPPPAASSDATSARQLALSTCLASALEQSINHCRAVLTLADASAGDKAKAGLRLGQAYRAQQNPQDAILMLNDSISYAPSAEAYNFRGIAHYDLEQWDDAIADYTAALRLEPDHGEALNNRAWTYFKTGRLKEALADADKAVTLLASKDYTWDTRGHIHEELGNSEKAIADYSRALALEPFNISSRDGLKRLNAR